MSVEPDSEGNRSHSVVCLIASQGSAQRNELTCYKKEAGNVEDVVDLNGGCPGDNARRLENSATDE